MKRNIQYYFHVNKPARNKYQITDSLFSIKGRVIFANFNAVKKLAESINSKRNVAQYPASGVSPALLNAMGLMDEIFHFIISVYKNRIESDIFEKFNSHFKKESGEKEFNNLFSEFIEYYPVNEIYSGKVSSKKYLKSETENTANQEIIAEEMLVSWIQNQNKAYNTLRELIDDSHLQKLKAYKSFSGEIQKFFKKMPGLYSAKVSLVEMLLLPAQLYPDSVFDQLKYMHDNWGGEIGEFLSRILISLDFIKEDSIRFNAGLFANPETVVAGYKDDIYFEPEAFSQDKDWMPHLVLMAKSTYVWMDQLSKQYGREINTLDKIPDEELNRLANFGFTGLWLIGLWERSHASRKIKQINGNPEAVASAYSLKNYDIAQDLGGFNAYQNLKERAWKRGIRLASDMVPNHMAIDSDWVRNHPHWFIHSDYPPFPGYSFSGPDLSDQNNMYIHIEDGYWRKDDAAVVFKRVDKNSGHTMYIYHGNDGTGMPWNDTAQLNYLIPEVREAVINTILHVARLFPVIRFDAAMTLAKKHYQRLWFPAPGSGGDIPSRSEYAMSKEEFDRYFPVEFWREVVDRVAQESPDTLLLAEAFWMMEGYFVRSLGMHRVYNSAFMNMLKNEENDKYKAMIKNVLEFNPQILKRYVNFMNNPDEKTAIEQFGKDDKYFGVCIVMCTMPGLPMFGHGQIEGYYEKYGMEYKKAYWNEVADQNLINRHRREVFPLLKKRKLFSEVDEFFLYDFANNNGVDENVLCFTNQHENEKALVLYNNAYNSTAGWIKHSAGYNDGSDKIKSKTILHALNLNPGHDNFTIFNDSISGMEYIRKNAQLAADGFYAELKGYNYQVYFIREVKANADNPYDQLWMNLNGAGVLSVEESVYEIKIAPVLVAFNFIFTMENLLAFLNAKKSTKAELKKIIHTILPFKNQIYIHQNIEKNRLNLNENIFIKWHEFTRGYKKFGFSVNTLKNLQEVVSAESEWIESSKLCIVNTLVKFVLPDDNVINTAGYFDSWRVGKSLIKNCALSEDEVALVKIVTSFNSEILFDEKKDKEQCLNFFRLKEISGYLGINFYDGVYYFNQEKWEYLVKHLFLFKIFRYISGERVNQAKIITYVNKQLKKLIFLRSIAKETGFNVDKLILAITQ